MKYDPLVEILKKEFKQKQTKNSSYSLHSFSRDLEIDVSNLSKILNSKKELGPRLRERLGKKIGFEKSEFESWWLKPSHSSKTSNEEYVQHSLKVFEIVSEWQHYAILEFFKLSKEPKTSKAAAERLGLSLENATQSIQRLIETGLLLKLGQGFKPAEESSSSILDTATSKAHRTQQKQILEGAIDALENVPIELRSQSSVTMAIDSAKLEKAKVVIKKFRRDLGRFLSTSLNIDEVYQLSVSLYPVTKTQKTKGEKR